MMVRIVFLIKITMIFKYFFLSLGQTNRDNSQRNNGEVKLRLFIKNQEEVNTENNIFPQKIDLNAMPGNSFFTNPSIIK